MLEEQIEQLQKIIDESSNLVFFGGAWVSTASILKDFRGENGLYKEKFPKNPEYYLSNKCLYEEPNVFFDFYRTNMNPPRRPIKYCSYLFNQIRNNWQTKKHYYAKHRQLYIN